MQTAPILFCHDCATAVPSEALICPACGCPELSADVARPIKPAMIVEIDLPFPWDATLRAWPPGGVVVLYGMKGTGKSTCAAQLLPDVWITTEQTVGQAAASIVWAQGGGYEHVPEIRSVKEPHQVHELLGVLVCDLVVLDSVTRLGSWSQQLEVLEAVEAWAQAGLERRACVVMQVNAKGQPAGLTELEHLAVAVVGCHINESGARRLSADKNRAGPLGTSYYELGADGLGPVRLPYSYSVEGRPGAYELVPFPTRGALWDGLLRERFKEEAEVGYASAARMVPGYPAGRLEPQDVELRRAFAEAHGLTWME